MQIIFALQANVNLSNAQKTLLIYTLKFQVNNCLLGIIKNHKKVHLLWCKDVNSPQNLIDPYKCQSFLACF